MNWVWTGLLGISVLASALLGNGAKLAASVLTGAREGVTLAISITGSICLWSGLGRLMEAAGITFFLSRLLQPLLFRLFPSSRQNPTLQNLLSANLCANLLGLGNAATPMGIGAAKALRRDDCATDELCRLIVLNTASIQLIPANVAAIRASLGCQRPLDILLPVWITSFTSAGLGLCAAWLLGKVWKL